MAGHSQWNNIKFRKARQDAQKSKIFTKFYKEIFFFAKYDPNPESNPSLRNSILQAKSNEMPNSIIEKAIRKAHEKNQVGQEVVYECIQGQNAFIILAITNNRTRTAAEIKEVLRNHHAVISKCQYMFEKMYMIKIPSTKFYDEVLSLCKKIEQNQEFYYLFFDYNDASKAYSIMKDFLIFAKVVFIPLEVIEPTVNSEALLEELEILEDVYEVHCNIYSFRDKFDIINHAFVA